MNDFGSAEERRAGASERVVFCKFCHERPATMHFGDMLSFTHGGGLNCCELCCAEQQLEHARERAALIPELEDRVRALRADLSALPKGPRGVS